ncbi:hypothetical protein ACFFX0_20945 [Citricoccus parietis]|uniref:Uncharacterized protein n=1 Tax=Citricoccus parietis TaxID=592307 RepID=A0ABV5G3M3_9MICC
MDHIGDVVHLAVLVHDGTLEQDPTALAVLHQQEADGAVRELGLVPDVQSLPAGHRADPAGAVTDSIPTRDRLRFSVQGQGALVAAGLEQMVEGSGVPVGVLHVHGAEPVRGPRPPGQVQLQAGAVGAEDQAPDLVVLHRLPAQRPDGSSVGGGELGREAQIALLRRRGEHHESVRHVPRRVGAGAQDERGAGAVVGVQVEHEPVEELLRHVGGGGGDHRVVEFSTHGAPRCGAAGSRGERPASSVSIRFGVTPMPAQRSPGPQPRSCPRDRA